MQQILYSQAYDILEENYGIKQHNRSLRAIHKVEKKRMPGDNNRIIALSVHFKNNEFAGNQENFQALQKLKYIGILQPMEVFVEYNETVLIYQDYLEYRLDEEKFQILISEGHMDRMLIQLALTFAELERRNFKWPFSKIEDFYYIDGLLLISLADYDFTSKSLQWSCFDVFQTNFNYFFSPFYPEIRDLVSKRQFNPIIDFLLNQLNAQQDFLQEPYEKLLKLLFKIDFFKEIYKRGNICVVKECRIPAVFTKIFPKLVGEQNIVYKLKQSCGNDEDGALSNNIRREIELMEQFNEDSATASCFTYFRIENLPFLFQKKFICTLAEALKKWNPSEAQLKKDVYTFSQRFATALVLMHSKNILHRDLKPENLFMDGTSLAQSWVYIADFDRSKQLQGERNMIITQENAANTQKYDPPEGDQQTLKYDIFQYGLIILNVANKGQYVGLAKGPRYMSEIEFNSFYGYDAINQRLKPYGYDESFIKIMHQCLKRDPSQRPEAQQIYDIVNKLNFRSKIKILSMQKIEQVQY